MSLVLQEVYELGLLGDGPLHFHLLMGVHSLQVELSEHHYCHECLLKHFISHRENGHKWAGCAGVLVCVLVCWCATIKNRVNRARFLSICVRADLRRLISRCV